jgi:hypothetical protein
MRTSFALIYFVFASFTALAQHKLFYKSEEKDNPFSNTGALQLAPMLQSKHLFHFRFWDRPFIIDIFTDDYVVFKGNICFTLANDTCVYTKKLLLDTAYSKRIYQLFSKTSVLRQSPVTSRLWANDLDGNYCVLEVSTPFHYRRIFIGGPYPNSNDKDERIFALTLLTLYKQPHIFSMLEQYLQPLPDSYYHGDGIIGIRKKDFIKAFEAK